mgnify:CR=1 FL=1
MPKTTSKARLRRALLVNVKGRLLFFNGYPSQEDGNSDIKPVLKFFYIDEGHNYVGNK